MKKIIICDKNKELIDRLRSRIEEGVQPSGVELTFVCGDIIDLHEKTPNSRIVTASNPSFSPDGGLDAELAHKYRWREPSEFKWNDALFWTVSVGEDRRAEKWRIRRALAGVLGYADKFTLLVPGLGTGVGGLDRTTLIEAIVRALQSADLRHANLESANLESANLQFANLQSADLRSAKLWDANLESANLQFANLESANLESANLQSADLRHAKLWDAKLWDANLESANLQFANLQSADLRSADLQGARNLETVRHDEHTAGFALACPDEGSFIGWKKASGYIIKLRIPAKALRSSATSRKCRCSEAKVLAIYDENGKTMTSRVTPVASDYDSDVKYAVGKVVKPLRGFNPDRWEECARGIHFFITREEAEQWAK